MKKQKENLTWDIEELRKLIKNAYNQEYLDKINKHISSVAWKLDIAHYHGSTACNAFKKLFSRSEESIAEPLQAMELMFSSGENKQLFDNERIKAEANAIALAQTMYSASDLIAYLIYHSLKLNGNVIDKTLKEVHKLLPRDGKIKSLVVELIGSKEFLYLKDFSNQTKHVSLIHSGYKAHLLDVSKNLHGMEFKSFTFIPSNDGKERVQSGIKIFSQK